MLSAVWICPEAAAGTKKILLFGDSLTAGYGLPEQDAFPARLEAALSAKGYRVRVINAGSSGATSVGAAARLEWVLVDQPDLAVIELGANDALRGMDPQQTKKNLAGVIERLQKERIGVLLAGMKAPLNFGETYYNSFERLYADLAQEFGVALYPFFLAGVAGREELNQADGIHPNAAGVGVIVRNILPQVEMLLQHSD